MPASIIVRLRFSFNSDSFTGSPTDRASDSCRPILDLLSTLHLRYTNRSGLEIVGGLQRGFGLISPIPDCFTVFFYISVFFFSFQLSLFPSVLVFLSQVSYLSHNRLFLDFYFFTFLVSFKTFFSFLVHVLD